MTTFSTYRVRCWYKLPREALDVPSLEALEVRLDGDGQPEPVSGNPAHGRGLELGDL